jgi:predicted phosphodiesterase
VLGAFAQREAQAYVPFQPFSFAYLSDVHLVNGVPDTYKLTQESQLFLQEVVKILNKTKVDFVVFGGDQVEGVGKDQANWQLFLDVVQGLGPSWSFVLGESDLAGDDPVDKMRTFGPDWKGRGINSTRAYWSLNPVPGVHIVGLDTSLPNSTVGGVSDTQLQWLKEDLATNKKYFTIIFCHHPILPPPPYDGGPPWDQYVIPDGASVREIIAPFPQVKLVISGHIHLNKVQKEGDVWHVSCSSLDVYPCQFKTFRVDATAITMETWQVPFPALIKKGRKTLIESNKASKYNAQHPDQFALLAEGTREDRDAILPLGAGKALQPLKKKGPAPGAEEKDKEKDKDKGKEAPAKKDAKKEAKEKKKAAKEAEKEAAKEAAKKAKEKPKAKDKKNEEEPKESQPAAPSGDNTEVETTPAKAPETEMSEMEGK